VAGFAVGIVEHDAIIDGPARCRPGDVLVGLLSPGLRSNGYSLARRALLEEAGRSLEGPAWEGAGGWTLADELLRPSVIYAPAVLSLLDSVEVHAVAHITGGGLPGNVPRVLADDIDAVFDRNRWPVPRIFAEVQRAGAIPEEEMTRVFNLGLGMVLALPPRVVDIALAGLAAAGCEARVVGHLVAGQRQVHFA
jgi:phosphoribosylformylglycinamidine cyclo-ligase